MKNYILEILVSFFVLLTLVSCSAKQDISAEIEQDVVAEFNKNNINSEFQSPEIFKNCKTDNNHKITVEPSESRIIIASEGKIESAKTKLNYSDVKIHVFKSMGKYSNSEDPEEAFEDYASAWISKSQIDFKKHIIDNKSYYITTSFADEQEDPASSFNILCLNNNNFVVISGTLNEATEIDQETEEKICKDFSTIES